MTELTTQVEEGKDEIKTLKRKHAANVKVIYGTEQCMLSECANDALCGCSTYADPTETVFGMLWSGNGY